jgi:hypothetical protein
MELKFDLYKDTKKNDTKYPENLSKIKYFINNSGEKSNNPP